MTAPNQRPPAEERDSTPTTTTEPNEVSTHSASGTTSAKGPGYESGSSGGFQPRIEAEEGEPTRFDFAVLILVVLLIVVALLWAFGVIDIPWLPF